MANRGVTFQQLFDRERYFFRARPVKFDGVKFTSMSGIDFTGRFGSVWHEDHGFFTFTNIRGCSNAMMFCIAVTDGHFDLIKFYIDNPTFDWFKSTPIEKNQIARIKHANRTRTNRNRSL
jgi:hypothetical protein